MHYFESYKGVDPIPAGTNPASWMLDVSLPGYLPCIPDAINARNLGMRFRQPPFRTCASLLKGSPSETL